MCGCDYAESRNARRTEKQTKITMKQYIQNNIRIWFFTFCADGWNYKKGIPKPGYVGGLQGWWIGKCGIEKYPLKNKVQALAKIKDFDASVEHHIQTGRAGNNLLLFVDGELVVEMLDKKPLNKYGRVGLGVYASKIFFRDFKVYKPYVKKFETSYEELRKQN